ncbi:MAG: HU family DNA-binding protein [Gammaproteobacteria bacterium]|jgi:nucleoid DNA-binding protein
MFSYFFKAKYFSFLINMRDSTMATRKSTKKRKATKKKVAKKVTRKPAKKRVAKKVKKVKKAPKKRKAAKAKKRKAAPKKAVVKKATMPKVRKTLTKSEICKILAEHAGVTKKQAKDMLDALPKVIKAHLAAGVDFKLDFVKITKLYKKAKKARKGINPFTGEEMMFKAKPAHHVVKVRALKKLKEMVG